jgi:hypothetical protein
VTAVPPFLSKPAILTHHFYGVRGSGPGGVVRGLREAWDAVCRQGFTEPVPGLPDTLRDPSAGAYLDLPHVLGARRKGGDGGSASPGVEEVVVCQVQDAVVLSVMAAPPNAEWLALDRDRLQGEFVEQDLLGSVVLYLGLVPDDAAGSSPALCGRRLRDQLPAPRDGEWPSSGECRQDGIVLWELPSGRTGPTQAHRRLLVVAPVAAEDAVDRWLWSDDRPGLVPFTGYLLHSAKLRYQHDVLVRDIAALRRAAARADARGSALTAALSDVPLPVGALAGAAGGLAALQADATALVTSLNQVRIMKCGVETAVASMAASLGPAVAAPSGDVLETDRSLGRWVLDQLRNEETYLAAAAENVTQVVGVASVVIEARTRERQEHLALLQTSALGFLVMALAANQSLQYPVRLPGALNAPVILLLASLALWLPGTVLHWPPGSSPYRGRRVTDRITIAPLAGAVGWLAVTAGWYAAGRAAAPWPVTAGAAACCAAASMLLVRSGRHREEPERP